MNNKDIREQLRKKGIYVFPTIEQWGDKTNKNQYLPTFGYDVYNYHLEGINKIEIIRYVYKTHEYKEIEDIMYKECKEKYLKE